MNDSVAVAVPNGANGVVVVGEGVQRANLSANLVVRQSFQFSSPLV